MASLSQHELFELHFRAIAARGLRKVTSLAREDPFIVVRCRDEQVKSEVVREGDVNPVFGADGAGWVSMVHACVEDNITFAVVHEGGLASSEAIIGTMYISANALVSGDVVEDWFEITHNGSPAGTLHMRLQLMHLLYPKGLPRRNYKN